MKTRSPSVDWLLKTSAIAAGYFLLARMALLLPIHPGQATPVWPAAGLALAGVLLFGKRIWPGILLGSIAATAPIYWVTTSVEVFLHSLLPPTQFAGAAVLEALFGAYLVRRFGFRKGVVEPRTVVGTMFFGGPVACFAGASIGIASLYLTGTVPRGDLVSQWLTYWAGDTVGVLVIVPLVFLWGMELRRASVYVHLSVGLPLVAMVLLTTTAGFFVRKGELQEARREFGRRSELMARTLDRANSSSLDLLRGVVALFESSEIVSREEFRTFASSTFRHHPELHGLSWNAIVSSETRTQFEEEMRQDGYPAFRITELGGGGDLVVAGPRDTHVVVSFIEPYEGNEQALGFDLTSNPVRRKALAQARDSGQIHATEPILLVQEREQKSGFLLFAPIFKKGAPRETVPERRLHLDSFVSGVFRAEQMVETSLQAFAAEGIGYRVTDTSDPESPHPLFVSDSQGRKPSDPLAALSWSTDLEMAGRRWSIRFWPTERYEDVADWGKIWAVLITGMLLTALLGALLLVVTGRAAAAERSSAALRHEIRERRLAEEERTKLETKVLQSQKLESLGLLAGGIAHDFNNLLMGILGHADLALTKLAPGEPARENVRNIEMASQRAAELANQLLAYSGKGRSITETVDLSSLVKEISDLVEVSASKTNHVDYRLETDLPQVDADPTQIRQIVLNLITNAAEAIGDASGTITLTTGAVECDSESLLSLRGFAGTVPGRYAFVEVTDTGVGMDEETQQKIFDPFFTTKFTGRGLGLAAVLGIVRSHNGAIDVQSEPGHGTTIRVLLPVSPEPARTEQTSDTREAAWKGRGVVLLVDDDPAVRNVVKEMLRTLGLTVLVAKDGVDAVEVYRQRTDEISVVLLDLAMPRMGGGEAFTELRKIRPDVQVILSSGYEEQETTDRFRGKGLAGFIHKPYRLASLREVFREVLGD